MRHLLQLLRNNKVFQICRPEHLRSTIVLNYNAVLLHFTFIKSSSEILILHVTTSVQSTLVTYFMHVIFNAVTHSFYVQQVLKLDCMLFVPTEQSHNGICHNGCFSVQ